MSDVTEDLVYHSCGHPYSTYGSGGQTMHPGDPCEDCANAPFKRLKQLILDKFPNWEHHRDCRPLSVEGCLCGLWDLKQLVEELSG